MIQSIDFLMCWRHMDMCVAFGPIYILFGLNKSAIEKSLKERNCDFNVKSTLVAAKFFDKQII